MPRERTMSMRQQMQRELGQFIGFIHSLRTELDQPEGIRLLKRYSAAVLGHDHCNHRYPDTGRRR